MDSFGQLKKISIEIRAKHEIIAKMYRGVSTPDQFIHNCCADTENNILNLLDIMFTIDNDLNEIIRWSERYLEKIKPYLGYFNISQSALSAEDIDFCDNFFSFLDGNMSQVLSCSMLCDRMALSYSTLYRMVRNIFGMSPYQVIIFYKMSYAKHLINSYKTSVKDAMLTCGFSNPSHFARLYMTVHGVLPSDNRSLNTYTNNMENNMCKK